jgi:hypothetical protein
MRPIKFKECTGIMRGDHLTLHGKQVGNLYVYSGNGEMISCWRASFVERLRILFGGKVWLRFHSQSFPPTVIETTAPFVRNGL